jgi:preprotein translocase subunit SecF
MEFFKIRRDIPFMRHALVLNAVSLVTFLAAVFFLFSRGRTCRWNSPVAPSWK